MAIHLLEPSSLWQAFSDLNAVPRPSKKEERVSVSKHWRMRLET